MTDSANFSAGHLLNSIGFANMGLFAWQSCYDTQASFVSPPAGNTSALNDVTAYMRGRCAINTAQRDASYWVESNDFFKLRNLSVTFDIPPRFISSSRATSLVLSGRNLFKSTNYTVPILSRPTRSEHVLSPRLLHLPVAANVPRHTSHGVLNMSTISINAAPRVVVFLRRIGNVRASPPATSR